MRLSEIRFAGMIQIEQIRPEKQGVQLKDRETTKNRLVTRRKIRKSFYSTKKKKGLTCCYLYQTSTKIQLS